MDWSDFALRALTTFLLLIAVFVVLPAIGGLATRWSARKRAATPPSIDPTAPKSVNLQHSVAVMTGEKAGPPVWARSRRRRDGKLTPVLLGMVGWFLGQLGQVLLTPYLEQARAFVFRHFGWEA
jgi:hypothetical protein